jgi:hypothetical protein
MSTITPRHVFAIPVGEDYVSPAILVGEASTIEDATIVVRHAGYSVIEPATCGKYDAEDAPGIYGYEEDGMGAFSVIVESEEEKSAADGNSYDVVIDPNLAENLRLYTDAIVRIHNGSVHVTYSDHAI